MLCSLSIKNYAIIKNLQVSFEKGFCVITGETGAGKSIIMGALGLILGQRADSSVINGNEGKCIVEGRFDPDGKTDLKLFFEENELDYELPVILRREIASTGKSRAFINDTPVQLNTMRELGLMMIDIHSQHSNLELGKRQFQLNVLDWYCGNEALLASYYKEFQLLRKLQHQRDELWVIAQKANADLDYYEYQFNQLNEAQLKSGEQAELESEQERLTHSEEIKSGLESVFQLLDNDDSGSVHQTKEAYTSLQKIAKYLPLAAELGNRMESVFIELRDIASECERLAEKTEYDPKRLELISDRLNTLYTLQQKHRVDTVEELIALREGFEQKIIASASYDEQLERLDGEINRQHEKTLLIASDLYTVRSNNLESLSGAVTSYLHQLAMPNAIFQIDIIHKDELGANGSDEVYFLFSANKAGQAEEINKVASGGELSRLMLAIKTVVARSKALPAIVFDEIDTGISGETANKMGNILREMSQFMQVINITHLPQIASKGQSHYQVYKNETNDGVETGVKRLNDRERITEIAKMLSGDDPHQSAIDNAKALLQLDNL